MNNIILEHVNMTVSSPTRTAELLCNLFGWRIRWQGPSLSDGETVHVGLDNFYLALYSPKKIMHKGVDNYTLQGGLNHIGVVVESFEETEKRVLAAGFITYSHRKDYDPCRRFYFNDHDGIEYEVVNY